MLILQIIGAKLPKWLAFILIPSAILTLARVLALNRYARDTFSLPSPSAFADPAVLFVYYCTARRTFVRAPDTTHFSTGKFNLAIPARRALFLVPDATVTETKGLLLYHRARLAFLSVDTIRSQAGTLPCE